MSSHTGVAPSHMTGADVVAEILRREGTEFISCYPRNPLIDACARADIRTVLCRQERDALQRTVTDERTPFFER